LVGTLVWTSSSPGRRPAPAGAQQARSDRLVRRRVVLGHSVEGRPIAAIELGDPDAPHTVLVVGAIHGDEAAGIAVARDLRSSPPPENALIWIVSDLNPDGVAAGLRQNADGVDLNRNFPWHWRPLDHRGGLHYSGPHALSEPESRIARSLILTVRPRITVWFHQPLGLIDESGGDVRVEHRFARIVGLPLTRLPRYPGSAAGWQNHRVRKSTAFVVELPPGSPSPSLIARSAVAVRRLSVGGDRGKPRW
jgi:protein MpaA